MQYEFYIRLSDQTQPLKTTPQLMCCPNRHEFFLSIYFPDFFIFLQTSFVSGLIDTADMRFPHQVSLKANSAIRVFHSVEPVYLN